MAKKKRPKKRKRPTPQLPSPGMGLPPDMELPPGLADMLGVPPDQIQDVLEAMMAQLGGQGIAPDFDDEGGPPPDASPAEKKAWELIDRACQTDNPAKARRLAEQAIEAWPDCVDGHQILGELERSPAKSLPHFENAVAAGQRSLGGPAALTQRQGTFWFDHSTRPYMHAVHQLADCLWHLGRHDEAISHLQHLLTLNPNDNQGIRYTLAARYSELCRDRELESLLGDYPDDGGIEWYFSRALLAFRQQGDTPAARELLLEAHDANPHVAAYFTGAEMLPTNMPEYVEMGGESEAANFAGMFLSGWRATPGAIAWLRTALDVELPEAPPRVRPPWNRLKDDALDLPQYEGEVWQADLLESLVDVGMGDDEPAMSFIVTCPSTGQLVTLDSVPDGEGSPQDLLADLVQGMISPASIGQDAEVEPHRPEIVEVREKKFFKAWRAKLAEIGVELELVDELDHVDFIVSQIGSMNVGNTADVSPEELAARVEELHDLERESEAVWQVGTRRLETWLNDGSELVRPTIALVVDPGQQMILAQNLIPHEPTIDSVRHLLTHAMLLPAVGDPRSPGAVECATPELQMWLEPFLDDLGIECRVADESPMLDFVLDQVGSGFSEQDTLRATIDSPGVTPRHVGGMFDAAADYYQQKPWQRIPGDTPVRIVCKKFQTDTWYAVIMGQTGMTLGLAMYEDLNCLKSLLSEVEGSERRNAGLSLMFGEKHEIAIRDLDAQEKHGWPVASPDAYPLVIRVNPGMAVRPLLGWELELMEAALRALPPFIKQGGNQAKTTVPTSAGPLDLELTRIEL